jgi:hypothetical protein
MTGTEVADGISGADVIGVAGGISGADATGVVGGAGTGVNVAGA